jgi:hypothetical protein
LQATSRPDDPADELVPPEDDLTVDNDMIVYRWVPPAHIRWTDEGPVPRDSAFKNFPKPKLKRISVNLEDEMLVHDKTPESLVAGRPEYGLLGFPAGACRSLDQRLEREPTRRSLGCPLAGKSSRSVRQY